MIIKSKAMGKYKDVLIELHYKAKWNVLNLRRKKYWVFRRYCMVEPNLNQFIKFTDIPPPNTWQLKESFALHFTEPFKTRKEAQKAIDSAKNLQPWQHFFIIKL